MCFKPDHNNFFSNSLPDFLDHTNFLIAMRRNKLRISFFKATFILGHPDIVFYMLPSFLRSAVLRMRLHSISAVFGLYSRCTTVPNVNGFKSTTMVNI